MRTAEHWQKVKQLFDLAVDRDPATRAEFLRGACVGDDAVREEVESLLLSDERGHASLINAFIALEGTGAQGPALEDREIGAYRIIKRIGSGGMGSVYLAERSDDQFRRRVAIKLVRADLIEPRTLRRFHNERNTLAALEHPNIVRLLDAGSTDDGIPYLVMDYVEGEPLDRYCTARSCSTREILTLFRSVCAAVHYAHQSLVVHRDLKPSNIVVTPEGVPKLLDFGIAKLLKPEYGQQAIGLTRTEAQPRTPAYASPEQIRGAPVTTASDVYALGVILYQLLAKRHPFEAMTETPGALEQAICLAEPARPGLGRDLDTMILTAMRKEPQRRYASAEHLSEDLRRYLDGLPVVARGDSVRYRITKFIQRNRLAVGAGAVVTVALIGSAAVSIWYGQVARVERDRAERRFEEVHQLASFVLFDLDESIRSGPTAARKLAVTRGLEYLNRLAADTDRAAGLAKSIVEGYLRVGDVQGNPFTANLGDTAGASRSYAEALRIAQASRTLDQTAKVSYTASASRKLGEVMALAGNSAEAVERFQAARAALESLGKETEARNDLLIVWERIGSTQYLLGDLNGALDSYSKYRALASEVFPGGSLAARKANARADEKLGQIFARRGDNAQALERMDLALGLRRRIAGETPDNAAERRALATTLAVKGDVLQHAERQPDAIAAYTESVAILNDLSARDPENHQLQRDRYRAMGFLAGLLQRAGRGQESRRLTNDCLRELERLLVRPEASWYDHRYYAWLLVTTPFDDLQNNEAARRHAARAAELTGGTDPGVLDTLALTHEAAGDFTTAAAVERKALSLPATQSNSHMRKGLEANLARFERRLAGKPDPAQQRPGH